MVLNEANSWSQPLVISKNSDIELIIPDIRTAGWAASYASAFKKEGTYFTYLYIYGVQTHRTIRETLYVNTRTRIAVVIENAFTQPSRVDLCNPDPSMPIGRITAIVKNVSDSFHGQSLDDAIAEQSYTVARMIACSDSPTSQDCTMSDAEYRAKHPRYLRARTPTEILLAQIAPMTVRQPNETCQGVPTDETPASSPSGQNTGVGLYGIGNGVSAPVVIHSVEAQFSDEARRAKYQGICLISLIVDAQGNPQSIRVARSLGKGLDEKAIEAVRQYKFSPAMKDGQTPVPVMITIEVDFKLY
jgi:TonB family protein